MNKNRLKTLALLSIPLAFLACSEPGDSTTTTGGQGQGQSDAKYNYAESLITNFENSTRGQLSVYSSSPLIANWTPAVIKASYDSFELWMNGQRESYYNAIKNNNWGYTYTQSELNGYHNRMMKIQSDVLNDFWSKFPNKNISYTLDK